jgi:hypothetical protein
MVQVRTTPHTTLRMTSERAHAYRRVIKTLDDVGPTKLHASEQSEIRHAADTLIFSRDVANDGAAQTALEAVERLCRALVDAGRWQSEAAMRLADDVAHCGPALLKLKAA